MKYSKRPHRICTTAANAEGGDAGAGADDAGAGAEDEVTDVDFEEVDEK
jgi:hypothetical protein